MATIHLYGILRINPDISMLYADTLVVVEISLLSGNKYALIVAFPDFDSENLFARFYN